MKRFIVSILCVTVFSIGLGALVEKAGARFKSDEKALALIRQARIAIGGEQSIADVRSMIIKGNTTVTLRVDGGATKVLQGETEIAMQLPDKLSKIVKIGRPDGVEGGEKIRQEQHDVLIMRGEAKADAVAGEGGNKVIVRKINGGDGNVEIEKIVAEGKDGEFTTPDGKTIKIRRADGPIIEREIVGGPENGKRIILDHAGPAEHGAGHRQNELLRTTLSLLLTAPEGMDVSYTFAGEGDVDGTACNIVNAEFGGSNFKLYLSKTSSLPVMVSYLGHAMPKVMFFRTKEPGIPAVPAVPAEPMKDKVVTFSHKIDAPELAEIQIRFADFRSVGGVQLPYKWTTSVAGQTSEVFDVTGYELNPANIAEKFQNQKVLVRTKKEAN